MMEKILFAKLLLSLAINEICSISALYDKMNHLDEERTNSSKQHIVKPDKAFVASFRWTGSEFRSY